MKKEKKANKINENEFIANVCSNSTKRKQYIPIDAPTRIPRLPSETMAVQMLDINRRSKDHLQH